MSMMDSLASLITPQLLGSLASRLGEPEGAVEKGITSGAATVLAALANRSGDSGFLSSILSLINAPGSGATLLGSLGGLASGQGNSAAADLGSRLLGLVLGSNQNAVGSAIASAAGLRTSSASGILNMVGPLVLGLLGQRVASGGLGASGLASLLSGEASTLRGLLPAGMSALLGLGSPSYATAAPPARQPESAGTNYLLPLLLLAALIGGLWWYFSRSAEPVQDVTAKVETAAAGAGTAVADAAKSMWAALGEFFKRKLPNGVEIDIPRLGVENKLIDFIEDTTKVVDKTTWFDFDRLLFDTGKATLQPASQAQLEAVAAVLKAFPNVHIRIGGYTDNQGDKAFNLTLSQDRANTVMGELVKLGIDGSRLSAEGYGEAHPVGDNNTEEGRQQNRRIAMRVTKK